MARVHGKLGNYTNGTCRCDACRAAFLAYMTAWRAAQEALGRCIKCKRGKAVAGDKRCRRHIRMDEASYHRRRAKKETP